MNLLFSTSNSLNRWFKADFPRLPADKGKQVGVNSLVSDDNTFSWQLHLIENAYQSGKKTIIACEANSRFTFFVPIILKMSPDEFARDFHMRWQMALACALESTQLIPGSDIACLLSDLSDVKFNCSWFKNTDLSINGHISDAGLWVTDTLREYGVERLSPDLADELAVYLNTQTKRVSNKHTGRKEKFVPVERLLDYCAAMAEGHLEPRSLVRVDAVQEDNVISLDAYRRR